MGAHRTVLILTSILAAGAAQAEDTPIPAGARVGNVLLERENVFDTSDPKTSGGFSRFFNRFS